jgi:Escherichia/Staphylococcus phage prohead protease
MPENALLHTGFYAFALTKAVDDEGTFDGYASTFGNVDLQGDVVLPGAFTETLKKTAGKVPILMAHNSAEIVGFGIEAAEDERGLRVRGQFTPDSDAGRNAAAIARHAHKIGHKLGLSMGYRVRKDGADWDESTGIRKLKAVDLYEYSIAAVPANPRARMTRVKTVREAEAALRELGLTGDEARQLISICKGEAGREPLDAPERDAKGAQTEAAAAFMAALRGQSLINELKEVEASWHRVLLHS